MTDGHNAKPLKKAFKGKLMTDINPFLVEKYKTERAKVVNKKTVNNEIALGSQVVKKAIEWKKWQGENPFAKARFKVDRGKKPGSLSPEQVEAIIAKISHPVKRDMVAFAFYQGWRISEIRKLKWEDVDLEKGMAYLP
jgi:integrase